MYYLLSQSDDMTVSVSLRFQCLIFLTCKFDKIKELFTYTHKACVVKIAKEASSTQSPCIYFALSSIPSGQ